MTLGILLLAAIGAGVYIWSELQERTRQLAEARVLRKLAVHEAQRMAALSSADVSRVKIARLDHEIDRLRREAVDVREDTSRMSSTELADAFNKLLRSSLLVLIAGCALWSAPAQAQGVIPLDHEGERGVWFPEEDAVRLLRAAQLAGNLERQVRLFEERLSLADEVIGNLQTAIGHGDRAIDAARQIAFAAEQDAINADKRASSPWPRLLWGVVGAVIGAAIGIVVFALVAGGG